MKAMLCLLGLLGALMPARAVPNRLYLAEQYNWSGNSGVFLDLENDADSGPCKLSTLQLILGVGDGSNWRYIIHAPAWQYNHDYTVKAVVSPTACELWLDGVRVGAKPGGYSPTVADLGVNDIPSWAAGPAEYLLLQTGLSAGTTGGRSATVDLSVEASRSNPLLLLAPSATRRVAWSVSAGETQTFTATFRIIPAPNPRDYDPYIDRYGQCRYADYPGKVQAEADLAAAAAGEATQLAAWGLPSGVDAYGGSTTAGWASIASGYFRTEKRDGFWWLISPLGNPCFYLGVCDAPALSWEMTPVTDRSFLFEELPPTTGAYASCWANNVWGEGQGTQYTAFHTANMIRKYGTNWQSAARQSARNRVLTLGFSGLAKWSDGTTGLPWIPVLNRSGVPNVVSHPDVFSSTVRAQFRSALANQVASFANNPFVIGCTVGSEVDEIITTEETAAVLARGSTVPAKRALVDYALANLYGGRIASMAAAWHVSAGTLEALYAAYPTPPASDVESLRRYYADQYYGFIYTTMKDVDPNHLYLGNWIIPGAWVNEEDWRLVARHCDVIGCDNYAFRFADARLSRLIREADKPYFVGEFSFPPSYRGQRGFGTYVASYGADEAASAGLYDQYVNDAAANPYCVGVCWFEYRDQAITGRGPGRGSSLVYGEDYAFGLVDMADNLKWDMVTPMRSTNLGALSRRLSASAAFRPLALAARALRIAGGLQVATTTDIEELDTVAATASLGRIDMSDAVALAARGL